MEKIKGEGVGVPVGTLSVLIVDCIMGYIPEIHYPATKCIFMIPLAVS